jgi:DNA-binding MarR family transcriptional regulator
MKHAAAIRLLESLRDWPKGKKRPYSALLILVALHLAGDAGLRCTAVEAAMKRSAGAASSTFQRLLESALVIAPGEDAGPDTWRITPKGESHLDQLCGREGERLPLLALLRTLRDWNQELRPWAQLISLLALDRRADGEMTAAGLAKVLGTERAGIAATLKPLIVPGLIGTRPNAKDKRAFDYLLTPLGREHVAALFEDPTPAFAE